MFRFMFVVCCFYVALTENLARALSEEEQVEAKKQFEIQVMSCVEENGITEEDIANLKNKEGPTLGANTGCFIACFMRLIDVMDDDGMILTKVPADSSVHMLGDADMKNKVEDFIKLCSNVNSKDVSDGKKGCERALLAFECTKDAKIIYF